MGTVSVQPVHRGQYLNEIIQLCRDYSFSPPHLIEGIINCRWKSNPPVDDTVGFVLLDDEEVCGFIGLTKSIRHINGKDIVVNAGSSGIVKPEYRNYSMKLFQKWLSEGDIVLDLTPTDDTYKIFMTPMFKCRQIDTASLAFSCFRLMFRKHRKATTDREEILETAQGAQRQLLEDNMGYRGRFCTVFIDGEPITVMSRVFTKAKIVKIADILYIDKPELFAKYPEQIMAAICRKLHTLFCWCDSRFLPQYPLPEILTERSALFKKPFSVLFGNYTAIRRNSICRVVNPIAEDITPLQIDSLYSEKIMM